MKSVGKIFENKDYKTLTENFLSLAALQIVNIVLPLITLPYILRIINFEKYGAIVVATALVAYFQSITDYSFKLTATRDIAIHKNSNVQLSYIYSKVMWVKTLFLIISLMVLVLIVLLIPIFYKNKEIFFFTIPILIGYALFPDWFFQGIEKMKFITFLNLGIKLFFTIGIFIFIKTEKDYWIYPVLQSLGYIFAGFFGQYILVKKFKIRLHKISMKLFQNTIKKNFPIFVNQFLPTLYNNSSVFLLGVIVGNSAAGIFNAINSIINLGSTIIEILSRVFFPFLNRNKSFFPKYLKLILIITLLVALGIIIGYKIILWYLNINYENSFLIISILSLGLIGYSLYNLFGINYFIVNRLDRVVMWNTIFSSIIGFLLAIPLISYLGIIGAALTLAISRWLMGGGLAIKYLKIQELR